MARIEIELEAQEAKFDRHHFRRLIGFIRPYRREMALAFSYMMISSGCLLAVPWLIQMGIDRYIVPGDMAGLVRIVVVLVLVVVVNTYSRYRRMLLMSEVGQKVLYDIRRRVFAHMQKLSLRFYESQPSGKIISRLTSDVQHLQDFLTNSLILIGAEVLTLVGIVVAMFVMHPKLAALSLLSLPLLVFVISSLRLSIRKAHQRERETMANIYANLQESISGVRIVQDFARQQVNEEHFARINARNLEAALVTARLAALLNPMVEITSALAVSIILWFGAYSIAGDGSEPSLTVGILVAFVTYLQQFYDPIRDLSNVYNTMQGAMASADRIFEVLDTEPEVAEKPGAYDLPVDRGRKGARVTLEGVTFGYRPDEPVLVDINLDVMPGETVALVGPTGAGKTSIVNLIARFYDPQKGRVLINGHDVRDVTLRSLREHVAIVIQDSFLFSGTVRDNLRYGRPDATDDEIIAAARAVYAHDFIMQLPAGYDTPVHERGGNLSNGQRQLLAFARALVADPAVLILDEATSNVDAATEVLIQRALARLLKGRTAFIVAHRLSTIRNADRIVVIADGRIQQMGTHEKLLRVEGLYRNLHEVRLRYESLV